jgi:hypothetical protein
MRLQTLDSPSATANRPSSDRMVVTTRSRDAWRAPDSSTERRIYCRDRLPVTERSLAGHEWTTSARNATATGPQIPGVETPDDPATEAYEGAGVGSDGACLRRP